MAKVAQFIIGPGSPHGALIVGVGAGLRPAGIRCRPPPRGLFDGTPRPTTRVWVLGSFLHPGGAADARAVRDLSPCPLPGVGRGTGGSLAGRHRPASPPSLPLPAPGRGEGRGSFPRRILAGRCECKKLSSTFLPWPHRPSVANMRVDSAISRTQHSGLSTQDFVPYLPVSRYCTARSSWGSRPRGAIS